MRGVGADPQPPEADGDSGAEVTTLRRYDIIVFFLICIAYFGLNFCSKRGFKRLKKVC